ncbi:MAG: hypothetical protein JWM58_2741 [Rhizobium sp.]|nr:hypothetical protein [Rhizobium sp.]
MPSAARAFGLGEGDAAFANVVRQIGGIGDISPNLLGAVSREFQQAYGAEAQAEFTRVLSNGALDARIAAASADIKGQAAFVATLLYTGEVTRGGRQVALYYPWCLAWKSLTFATAPGLCGGPAFGHWANPPIPGAM